MGKTNFFHSMEVGLEVQCWNWPASVHRVSRFSEKQSELRPRSQGLRGDLSASGNGSSGLLPGMY